MCRFQVNHTPLQVEAGTFLLKACLENGIYIPNLCFVKSMTSPPASCRLCFVAVEGESQPITACTVPVEAGLRVQTDTLEVRRLQRSAFKLLMSTHHIVKNCPAREQCDLVKIAKFLGVGLKPDPLTHYVKEPAVDASHPHLVLHLDRCVLCGKCIYVCRRINEHSYLSFAKRGFDTFLTSYQDYDAAVLPCPSCQACIKICPVRAITLKPEPAPPNKAT
jgi:predicted molibdopterin-dependent oxidoreductase YjgC